MVNLFKMDKYEIVAVLSPAIISLSLIVLAIAPFFDFEAITHYTLDSTNLFVSLGVVTLGFYAVIHLYMTAVQRFSKYFIEQLFFGKNNQRMPTTLYLLYNEDFGDSILAEQVRIKVKSDFEIDLPTKTKEKNNRTEAVKTIIAATKLIKKRNQEANNEMYNRRNRRYGQCRNTIGGCLISMVVSLIALYILHNTNSSIMLPLCSCLIALAICLFNTFMYNRLAEEFASDFFETYLNTK